jgi:hypothetical protein
VLVRQDDDGALVIGQLSHAWLSGQLARAWGNERFPAPEPREEVVLGAEQHDVGWALFDLEPTLSEQSGLPRSFLESSVEEHLAIWRDAPDRLCSVSLHAALVVSMHGCALSELRASAGADGAELLHEHVEAERRRQRRLRETLGISEEHALRIRRQMWTWDGLSLALCLQWRPFTAHEVPGADGPLDVELSDLGDGRSTLEPWPFTSERVEVRCEARRLAARYEDEQRMRADYEAAEPVTLGFLLART